MNYFDQESKRLRFRKLTSDDIPSWIEFFKNNDRLHFLGMDLSKDKAVLAKEWVMMQLERYQTQGLGHLAVELKTSGAFIGMGGILPRVLEGKTEYEVAYSLLPKFWGKGYGTEIAIQMKAFGLKQINSDRLISIIEVNNVDSIKVAKKNGMKALFETEYLGMEVVVYGVTNEGL
ncbi:GNAT family N-acetyltransferase [Aureispira anguillae]|uniref:GNAT family N-acetyltransferase n=1 Tax=Aureispira anguillae TaxID=2864201 RepID=A0A915YBY9_9BACT|nr:GNAT family N-acetyltransferase [Aureispira anguillae]BDS10274.1 GNAT family N-acetyltransferase [Aureispira anguillae]